MASTEPVTQILHLRLENSNAKLNDSGIWAEALDICERAPGFVRLYWGRSHEHPEHVELHVGE